MYDMAVPEVIPSEEARRRLPGMLSAIRRGGGGTRFVIGRHRRPEAVLLPLQDYERLVEDAGEAPDERDPARLVKEKRDEILRIARSHGASNVRVFGSVVRGDARPDSDIDFLVDMRPDWSLLDLGGLFSDLQELLGSGVDVVPAENLKPRIRDRVLREAVSL